MITFTPEPAFMKRVSEHTQSFDGVTSIPTNHPDASEAKNQREVLIRAFRNGERLTVLSAMKQYGVYALSQRVGEIIKSGVDVKKDWLDLPNKKRVRVYFMEGV